MVTPFLREKCEEEERPRVRPKKLVCKYIMFLVTLRRNSSKYGNSLNEPTLQEIWKSLIKLVLFVWLLPNSGKHLQSSSSALDY